MLPYRRPRRKAKSSISTFVILIAHGRRCGFESSEHRRWRGRKAETCGQTSSCFSIACKSNGLYRLIKAKGGACPWADKISEPKSCDPPRTLTVLTKKFAHGKRNNAHGVLQSADQRACAGIGYVFGWKAANKADMLPIERLKGHRSSHNHTKHAPARRQNQEGAKEMRKIP